MQIKTHREKYPKLIYTGMGTELVTDTEEKIFGVIIDQPKYDICAQ